MPGTAPDLSAYEPGQTYAGTFSGTVNECDIIDPPPWAKRVEVYSANACRLGDPPNHSGKSTSSTLTDAEAHKPIAATTWMAERLYGGPFPLSCATASAAYKLVFHPDA